MQPTQVVGRRVAAFLLDALIVFAFNTALFFAMAQTNSEISRGLETGEIEPDANAYLNLEVGDDTWSLVGGDFALYALITGVVGIAWWIVLPGLKGWTPGKLALGLRVVREDGTCPAGIGRNVVRQLLWIADGFPYFIPYLTGFVVALTNGRNQRVGDMVAGTLVVRAEVAGAPAAAEPVAAAAGGATVPLQPVAAAGGSAGGPPLPPPPPPPAAPADWYPDPRGEKRLRYWDGTAWTEHTAD